ncbi:MAG: HAD family phosphatase [Thermoleophilia bacterium]|nr:HAD family phosphatase [Thermoleophilia bacterium]
MTVDAVVFDLDGLLLDTEQLWDSAREALARERGGRWHAGAQRDMMGMSSLEWSRYMHDMIGVADPPDEISRAVVERMGTLYRERLPIVAGAVEAVERLAAYWPLALASSSNRPLIDLALELSGMNRFFAATVSSEEVPRGKPAPDVYLEAARRLGADPARIVAVEDSHNGILSAKGADMRVIAVPNAQFSPGADALARADAVVNSLSELTPAVVAGVAAGDMSHPARP